MSKSFSLKAALSLFLSVGVVLCFQNCGENKKSDSLYMEETAGDPLEDPSMFDIPNRQGKVVTAGNQLFLEGGDVSNSITHFCDWYFRAESAMNDDPALTRLLDTTSGAHIIASAKKSDAGKYLCVCNYDGKIVETAFNVKVQ